MRILVTGGAGYIGSVVAGTVFCVSVRRNGAGQPQPRPQAGGPPRKQNLFRPIRVTRRASITFFGRDASTR